MLKKARKFFLLMALMLMAMGLLGETAEAAAKKAAISKKSVSVTEGKTVKISMKNTGELKVTWSTSNAKIAAVKANGADVTITGRSAGSCKVTARVNGKKYTCSVTVKKVAEKVPSIKKNSTEYMAYNPNPIILTLPVDNLTSNAKISSIKCSNSKYTATFSGPTQVERGIDICLKSDKIPSATETMNISFNVIQNGKTYKLSCKRTIKPYPQAIKSFKFGSEEYASGFKAEQGSWQVSSFLDKKPVGKKKISVKMMPGYKLESIRIQSGKVPWRTIKNGTSVSMKDIGNDLIIEVRCKKGSKQLYYSVLLVWD